MNCRERSCFHFLKDLLGLNRQSAIYVTEQVSSLFRHVHAIFPRAIGSENLGSTVPDGGCSANGIRNECPTRLSFSTGSLECVASFDRLQCVQDYPEALKEMARCLRPKGHLLLTVPFHFDQEHSVVRAGQNAAGKIVHHQPPIFHHDPVNPKGLLSYHDFGWNLLATIESAGFSQAELLAFTAPHFGYTGMQYVIHATRAAARQLDIKSLANPKNKTCLTTVSI